MADNIESIARVFDLRGKLLGAEPFGSGHINDTYVVNCSREIGDARFILQRINHEIFKDPFGLMKNVVRVTEHICEKLKNSGQTELAKRAIRVIKTSDKAVCYKNGEGNYWRMYTFVENAKTYDAIETRQQAYEAARMFGWFQNMLTDLQGPELFETIPGFHDTPKRFKTFKKALEADVCGRAKGCKEEIDFVLENAWICDVLLDLVAAGEIPVRITHNDTKINNVMLDAETDKGVCVVDLDTVMPGLSLYDFGDMVRTATSPAEEDEKDLSKVTMRMEIFEALVEGFLAETGGFMTTAEKEHLAFSGKLITFEQLIRFLSDHLAGDVYYKIHREGHNLDRSRTQMKLVQSIMEQEEQMNAFVAGIA